MTDLTSVINRVLPQTVAIIAPTAEVLQHLKENPQMAIEPPISGSGYIYSKDGYIITNHHVIAQADPQNVEVLTFCGKRIAAKIIGSSAQADVAVLQIKPFNGMQLAKFGDSDKVGFGNPCFAIGAPRALEFTVSQGIISNPKRYDRRWKSRFGDVSILPIMQTDASVNPGNSGGALFNANGEVIGMNTFIQTAMVLGNINGMQAPIGTSLGSIGLNFALTGNAVKKTADKIIAKGGSLKAKNPGFSLNQPTALDRGEMKDPEARVTQVIEGSDAEKAGLIPGDIILEVNGIKTDHALAAQYQLFTAAGEKAKLKIRRTVGSKSSTRTLEFRIPNSEVFIGWDNNPNGGAGGKSLDKNQHMLASNQNEDDDNQDS